MLLYYMYGDKMKKEIRKMFKDLDKPLLLVSVILIIWGLLNIVTASSRESVIRYDQTLYYYFYKQLFFSVAALIGAFIIVMVPTKNYKWIIPILVLGVSFMMVGAALSESKRGSHNWFMGLQPSEFAKPIFIVALAFFYENNYKKIREKGIEKYNAVGKAFVLTAIAPFIILWQKDLGTMFITTVIVGSLFLFSPLYRKDKLRMIEVVAVVGVIFLGITFAFKGYILSEEQTSRITSFLSPCKNYDDAGYQICNGYIAINEGGLFGLGLGRSKQKYSYIPEPHTDSVFAIMAEEIGLVFSTIIFILYFILIKRILHWAKNASTISGKYICLGIAVYIMMHIIVNLGGLFGLMPLTGVPLPFFTYGGSFGVSLIASLAIVQRVCIETKRKKIKL